MENAPGRHRRPPSLGRRLTPLLAAGGVLLALGAGAWGVSLLAGGSADPSSTAIGTPSATAVSSPSPTAAVVATKTPTRTPTQKAKPPAHRAAPPALVVDVIGSACYLRVRGPGGAVLADGVLHKGARRIYRVHPIDVVLGDAGAARIAIRGVVKSPAGRPGQVLRFRVG